MEIVESKHAALHQVEVVFRTMSHVSMVHVGNVLHLFPPRFVMVLVYAVPLSYVKHIVIVLKDKGVSMDSVGRHLVLSMCVVASPIVHQGPYVTSKMEQKASVRSRQHVKRLQTARNPHVARLESCASHHLIRAKMDNA